VEGMAADRRRKERRLEIDLAAWTQRIAHLDAKLLLHPLKFQHHPPMPRRRQISLPRMQHQQTLLSPSHLLPSGLRSLAATITTIAIITETKTLDIPPTLFHHPAIKSSLLLPLSHRWMQLMGSISDLFAMSKGFLLWFHTTTVG
jgi:hypothetical protein